MEGLRLLPWVQAHRDKRDQPDFLKCDTCSADTRTRRRWHCGYEPTSRWSEWHGGYPQSPIPSGIDPRSVTVCPGYTTTMPMVLEGARANLWREKGCIRDYCDGPVSPLMRDAVDIVESERNQCERYWLEEATSGSG